MGKKYVVLGKHDKDCFSLRNATDKDLSRWRRWPHPWGVIEKPVKFGSLSHPNRSGTKQWSILGCNDGKCTAKLAFRLDAVLADAPMK